MELEIDTKHAGGLLKGNALDSFKGNQAHGTVRTGHVPRQRVSRCRQARQGGGIINLHGTGPTD